MQLPIAGSSRREDRRVCTGALLLRPLHGLDAVSHGDWPRATRFLRSAIALDEDVADDDQELQLIFGIAALHIGDDLAALRFDDRGLIRARSTGAVLMVLNARSRWRSGRSSAAHVAGWSPACTCAPRCRPSRTWGLSRWHERARQELRASGETARRLDRSAAPALTPQELQIARLVRQGLSNRDVAAQPILSPRTVDFHLRDVFAKLGLTSRTELAAHPPP